MTDTTPSNARVERGLGISDLGRALASLYQLHGSSIRDEVLHLWRWPCPACGGGEADPLWRPLVLADRGRIGCECCCADAKKVVVALAQAADRANRSRDELVDAADGTWGLISGVYVSNRDDYYRSPEWRQRREIALREAGNRCELCPNTRRLQVHHRTYERLGNEARGDLIVLCDECHRRHHGYVR